MADLTLDIARKILDAALAKGIEKKFKPLVVAVLDARGCIKITAAQDGTSLLRAEVAHAKAYGALAMAELSLLPAARKADATTLIVADGTSCRHQIKDGAGREALHVARILALSLDAAMLH